jgi:hypothetical protein
MMKRIIEARGEYTWKIPCGETDSAGIEITINSGRPTGRTDAGEIYDIDGFSGLQDGFVKFRGYDNETGWESEWICSLESFIRVFAIRCADSIHLLNGKEEPKYI